MAEKNERAKNNFVRIESKESSGVGRSQFELGGNAGFFVTSDNLGKSTTAAHEKGHGFGLEHSAEDQRGQGAPDIMAARGTQVDPQNLWNPNAKEGERGSTVNPIHRVVKESNISDMFKGIEFSDGRANIGGITNTKYYSTVN